MEDFYQNDTAPSGYPEGFDGTIDNASQNVMPTLSQSKPPLEINFKIIGLLAGCVLLIICIVLLMINLLKPKNEEEESYGIVAEKFVETIKTGDQEVFEPYIYKDSQMDDFMDKVLGRFEGSSLNNADITYNDKEESAEVLFTFTDDKGVYSTTASLETKNIKGNWYLYSCKFSDFEYEEVAEEPTPTDAETRTLVNVGTDRSGYFDVPNDFKLGSLTLASTDNIAYDYTLFGNYQGNEESVAVIVWLEYQPLSALAESISQNMFGSVGEIVLETDKNGDIYKESRNIDGMITDVRTFLGSDGLARTFIIKYVEGDGMVQGLWSSYNLPAGVVVEPTPTDATQIVGSESLGTLEIPGEFTVNEDYSADGMETVGYSLDEKVVVLMNYAGTEKESISLKKFAKGVRENLLGDEGSEFEFKEDFPNAYYSYGIGEDGVKSEMYAFRGTDDINRLILIIHNQDDEDTAGFYRTYSLDVGIKELE